MLPGVSLSVRVACVRAWLRRDGGCPFLHPPAALAPPLCTILTYYGLVSCSLKPTNLLPPPPEAAAWSSEVVPFLPGWTVRSSRQLLLRKCTLRVFGLSGCVVWSSERGGTRPQQNFRSDRIGHTDEARLRTHAPGGEDAEDGGVKIDSSFLSISLSPSSLLPLGASSVAESKLCPARIRSGVVVVTASHEEPEQRAADPRSRPKNPLLLHT